VSLAVAPSAASVVGLAVVVPAVVRLAVVRLAVVRLAVVGLAAGPAVVPAVAPVHSLPWYLGAAAFAIWAGAAFGFTLLVRRRVKAQAERRRDLHRSRRRPPPPGPVRDDRSLGSGADLEPW
jgi:hypothetical protein